MGCRKRATPHIFVLTVFALMPVLALLRQELWQIIFCMIHNKRNLVYLNLLKCIVIFFHTSILTGHRWKLNPLFIILYFWLFKCTKFFQTSLLFHFPDTSATTRYAICLYINQITLFHSVFPIGKWPDWEEVQSESRESSLEALESIYASDGGDKQRQWWQR